MARSSTGRPRRRTKECRWWSKWKTPIIGWWSFNLSFPPTTSSSTLTTPCRKNLETETPNSLPNFTSTLKIRKASAEQVYLVLLQNGSLVAEEKMEKALEIISETCWEGDVDEAKQQGLQLCDIAGIEAAQFLKTSCQVLKETGKRSSGADENAYYSSLVGSAGF